MNMRFVDLTTLVLVPMALIAACSSSTSSPGPSAPTDAAPALADATIDGASEASPPPVPDAAPDTAVDARPDARPDAGPGDASVGECSPTTTQSACTTCCAQKHNNGAAAYIVAVNDCMCVAARCLGDCADTFCSPAFKAPDARCNVCITAKTGECSTQIAAQCMADPDCVAFDRCVGESGCQSKP